MLCRLTATRHKALRLGIVLTVDIAHQLGHDVLVIPGRAERMFSHHPAFAEKHKVDIGGAFYTRRSGEHGENRGVRMIKEYRADRAICGQVIFARSIVAVPGHDVERRLSNLRFMELPTPFNSDG